MSFTAAVLTCLVVGISDGDTLTARCPTGKAAHPYQQVKVRLAEIDAPERGQAFGQRSRKHLSDLCFKAQATIRPTTVDRWNRIIARVECKGVDANLAMVNAGMAWAFTRYQTDAAFPKAEARARSARLGLWADPRPVAPWLFRRQPASKVTPDKGPCYIGPRGGRYQLLPDGSKRYGC